MNISTIIRLAKENGMTDEQAERLERDLWIYEEGRQDAAPAPIYPIYPVVPCPSQPVNPYLPNIWYQEPHRITCADSYSVLGWPSGLGTSGG